jgi:hypothetical protein
MGIYNAVDAPFWDITISHWNGVVVEANVGLSFRSSLEISRIARLLSGESPCTNSCCTPGREITPTLSLLADQLVDMRSGIIGSDTSGEVAIGFKFHWGDWAWTVERIQARAGWIGGGPPCLTGGIGDELLLVHVHLALDLGVLSRVPSR